MTIEADGQSVLCNFGCDDEVAEDAPLCIIPTQALDAVKDPVNTLEKPNVMTPWLDLLTAAGAKILLMHGRYFDKFSELAEDLENGVDDFEMWQRRADGVVDHVIEHGLGKPGRIVFMGSSRHGFAVLLRHRAEPKDRRGGRHRPGDLVALAAGIRGHGRRAPDQEARPLRPGRQATAETPAGADGLRRQAHRPAPQRTPRVQRSPMPTSQEAPADRLLLTPMEIPGHSGGPPMHVNETVSHLPTHARASYPANQPAPLTGEGWGEGEATGLRASYATAIAMRIATPSYRRKPVSSPRSQGLKAKSG